MLSGLAAVALGYWEAATVTVLRHVLHIPDGSSNVLILERLTGRALRREQWRQICRLAALVLMSVAAARSLLHGVVLFGWSCALWTLTSYGWLRFLVDWPRSLAALDCFLLPRPWFVPVWIPLALSVLTALSCAGALLWLPL